MLGAPRADHTLIFCCASVGPSSPPCPAPPPVCVSSFSAAPSGVVPGRLGGDERCRLLMPARAHVQREDAAAEHCTCLAPSRSIPCRPDALDAIGGFGGSKCHQRAVTHVVREASPTHGTIFLFKERLILRLIYNVAQRPGGLGRATRRGNAGLRMGGRIPRAQ